ncbi:MAG: hypothetical protein V4717_21150 [Bacteroidota bacterium]
MEPYAVAYKFANNTNPLLNLFHADNIVDISKSTNPTSFNSLGWQRDSKYFWNNYSKTPLGKEALSIDNLALINKNETPVVDEQWNNVMKKFGNDGELDEAIHHHHHIKGKNAIPIPKSRHIGKGTAEANHNMNKRVGSVSQTTGRFLGKTYSFFSFLTLFNSSPNGIIHTFHNMGSGEENRAYPITIPHQDKLPGSYYEWKWLGKPGESEREFKFYENYEKRDGQWRGVNPVGEPMKIKTDGKPIIYGA